VCACGQLALGTRRGWVIVCGPLTRTALTRSRRGVACVRRRVMSSANNKLCDAAERGDVAEIERQIAAGADANAFEGMGRYTPLQWAAYYGHVAAMAALLAAGARVDSADSCGTTPLIWAAYSGHTVAIDALLAAGADVHHVTVDSDTALHYALMEGRLDAARVLLEAGAWTDVRNRRGERPTDVRRAPLSRTRSLRLRGGIKPLCHHVAVRRCASGPAMIRRLAPCRRCLRPQRPGPAAVPSPSPAMRKCGSGRRSGGAWMRLSPPLFRPRPPSMRQRKRVIATPSPPRWPLAASQADVARMRSEVASRDACIAARDRETKAAAAALAAQRDRAISASHAERDRLAAALVTAGGRVMRWWWWWGGGAGWRGCLSPD
jgi:hypothetical protein